MSRPLIVSDCDEVLLHMVAPFRDWLVEKEGVSFHMNNADFAKALRYVKDGSEVPTAEIWNLLNRFFDTEMYRQQAIVGAVAGINAISENADVVILTNLDHHRRDTRTQQLAGVGINARVFTNQGPKGPALQAILGEYQPSTAVFIDDLAQHHGSAAEMVPHIDRLHLCGEPSLAPHITCGFEAGHAHARIDTWEHALPWLLSRL
ncbi:MAG: HAD family hydrolase [Novosphingobium sp.]